MKRAIELKQHQGFSLIELMTVLSVTVVLAAILIPVAFRMKNSAEATKCASNLRQIGMVLQIFSTDNNHWIPGWYDKTDNKPYNTRYFMMLAPYILNEDLKAEHRDRVTDGAKAFSQLRCPAIEDDYAYVNASHGLVLTYSVNSFGGHYTDLVTRPMISDPSEVVYMADGYALFYPASAGTNHGYPPTSMPPTTSQAIYFPHEGKANALFLDGHVESFTESIPKRYLNAWGD
ncbi:MAG: prepilin-type N-terminal cleavage/methylation domain-containing protein [Puniceicoccales bacterium]